MNAYIALRKACLATATRPYLARGRAVKRCSRCQLSEHGCICAQRPSAQSSLDWVLLMHRDEVFKPTNTGRLIADVFPHNTYAFEWSRTRPCPNLLALLEDRERRCVIAFPPAEGDQRPQLALPEQTPDARQLTVIVPDGTWKQATKMVRASSYLAGLPLLKLADTDAAGYALRQAVRAGQLSTAEAAVAILNTTGETRQAEALAHYFAAFNEAYTAMRGRG